VVLQTLTVFSWSHIRTKNSADIRRPGHLPIGHADSELGENAKARGPFGDEDLEQLLVKQKERSRGGHRNGKDPLER